MQNMHKSNLQHLKKLVKFQWKKRIPLHLHKLSKYLHLHTSVTLLLCISRHIFSHDTAIIKFHSSHTEFFRKTCSCHWLKWELHKCHSAAWEHTLQHKYCKHQNIETRRYTTTDASDHRKHDACIYTVSVCHSLCRLKWQKLQNGRYSWDESVGVYRGYGIQALWCLQTDG